ncbi:hypothetical protein B0J13DRAFT_85987 [Dactylonectria estremocensis]|uniref:Uncharacterized protein n=1 Tax=Dactylonectria estremocensis TaxID=1079267 RepID=A0A9P9IV35_9HYPO|nr:hypothetical protein B0J13DRAFT_85987 [Dactylonectria estremocensis]
MPLSVQFYYIIWLLFILRGASLWKMQIGGSSRGIWCFQSTAPVKAAPIRLSFQIHMVKTALVWTCYSLSKLRTNRWIASHGDTHGTQVWLFVAFVDSVLQDAVAIWPSSSTNQGAGFASRMGHEVARTG